jgi:hypothetical protein
MPTIASLSNEALDVQDASNLSGVVHTFARVMTDLRRILESDPDFSIDKLNRHPIAILFSDKIADLTGSHGAFSLAYQVCKMKAGKV